MDAPPGAAENPPDAPLGPPTDATGGSCEPGDEGCLPCDGSSMPCDPRPPCPDCLSECEPGARRACDISETPRAGSFQVCVGGGEAGAAVWGECVAPVIPGICQTAGAFADAPRLVSVGAGAEAITLKDLDGDARLDIIASHAATSTLSVALNAAEGHFAPAIHSPALPGVVGLVPFPEGGWAALAVALETGAIEIFEHAGNGALVSTGVYPGSPAAQDDAGYVTDHILGIGHIDGDAFLDLVVSNRAAGVVSVLLHDADGLAPAVSYPIDGRPQAVAVADFDADGLGDVATVDVANDDVAVLLNRGDGTLDAPRHYRVGRSPNAIQAGDLNGDGRIDLAVAIESSEAGLGVLFNFGEGSFTDAVNYDDVSPSTDLALDDVNADGALDIVAAHSLNASTVLLNQGSGSFAPMSGRTNGSAPVDCALGDVDGDDLPDLVSTDDAPAGFLALSTQLLSPDVGGGNASSPDTYFFGWSPYTRVLAADLDGDRGPDVVLAGESPVVGVFLNRGTGKLEDARLYGIDPELALDYPAGGALAAADLNGDGATDLVLSSLLMFNRGDGSFEPPLSYTTTLATRAVTADFDGDGDTDIALTAYDVEAVMLHRNDGSGSFTDVTAHPVGALPGELAAADFDGDGRIDLAVRLDGRVGVLLNQEDGTFVDAASLAFDGYLASMVVADFGADGAPDIAISTPGGIILFSNDGAAGFADRSQRESAPGWLAAGDLNRDGLADLVLSTGEQLSVYLNADGALLPLPQTYGTDGQSYVATLDDLNGDGAPDLILASDVVAGLSVQLSTSCEP